MFQDPSKNHQELVSVQLQDDPIESLQSDQLERTLDDDCVFGENPSEDFGLDIIEEGQPHRKSTIKVQTFWRKMELLRLNELEHNKEAISVISQSAKDDLSFRRIKTMMQKSSLIHEPKAQVLKVNLKDAYEVQNLEELKSDIKISSDDEVVFLAKGRSVILLSLKGKVQSVMLKNIHESPIIRIVVTAKRDKVVLCSEDGLIKVWNFDEKTLSLSAPTQRKYDKKLKCVALASNSDTLISCHEDGTFQLWSLSKLDYNETITDTCLLAVSSIAITHDRRFIICGNTTNTIYIWDFKTRKMVHCFDHAQFGTITYLRVSHDDTLLYSGSDDGSVAIWDLVERVRVELFPNVSSKPLTGLTLSNNNQFILTASDTGAIGILSPTIKTPLYKIKWGLVEEGLTDLAITNDNRRLIAVDGRGNLLIIKLEFIRKNAKISLPVDTSKIKSLEISEDGVFAVSKNKEHGISLFRLDVLKNVESISTRLLKHVRPHEFIFKEKFPALKNKLTEITEFTISPDARYVALIFSNHSVQLGYLDEDEDDEPIAYVPKYPPYLIYFSKSNKKLIFLSRNKKDKKQYIHVWDIENDPKLKNIEVRELNNRYSKITCLTTMNDENGDTYLIAAFGDRSIVVWHFDTLREVRVFTEAHETKIRMLETTHDNKLIISVGSEDCLIKVWDLNAGLNAHVFKSQHATPIRNLVVSPDNKYLHSTDFGSNFEVFNLANLQRVLFYTKPVEFGENSYPTLSPDTKRIVFLENGHAHVVDNSFSENGIQYSTECRPHSIFGGLPLHKYLQTSIWDIQTKKNIIQAFPNMIVNSSGQNWLHIIAIGESRKELTLSCLEAGVPFIMDNFGKTPLYYLFRKSHIDLASIKLILGNFDSILENTQSPSALFASMSEDIPSIIKLDCPQVVKFLNLCFREPEPVWSKEITYYGQIKNEKNPFYQSALWSYSDEVKAGLIALDDKSGFKNLPKVSIRVLPFAFDYKLNSQDMIALVDSLSDATSQEIFETRAISLLISYLWQGIQSFYIVLAILFSIQTILISLYTALDQRNYTLEIPILVLGVFFLSYEAIELIAEGYKAYLSSAWNYIDLPGNTLIILTILLVWMGLDHDILNWLFSFMLAFTYVRLISYFRMIKQTRKLVRVIIRILKDIRSFAAILICLSIGQSLIFLQFDRNTSYSTHLLTAYELLFSDFDLDGVTSTGQLVFLLIEIAQVCIILLNILVAIMGGSFSALEERAVIEDSQEQLVLIAEYRKLYLLKSFFTLRKERNQQRDEESALKQQEVKKRYLFYAEENMDEEVEEESETAKLQNTLTNFIKNDFVDLKNECNGLEKDISEAQEKINAIEEKQKLKLLLRQLGL